MPIACQSCAEWNASQAPFRIFGNTYYIGVQGLSSVLIATNDGLILIDGGLPQSAPKIAENLATLGFRTQDVKWILNSHAHFDHAGGLAALQRMSGAAVGASPRGAQALRAGTALADDPQAGFGEAMRFPPVAQVIELADVESIRLGEITLIARHTPGHTPGGSSWTWRSCESGHCWDIVYADSLTAVSAPGFRFSADSTRVAEFRHSIAEIRKLPCDILITAHPNFSDLFEKFERRGKKKNPFVDADACRSYADNAETSLNRRLREEKRLPVQPR